MPIFQGLHEYSGYTGSLRARLLPDCPARINLRHNRTLNWNGLFGYLPILPFYILLCAEFFSDGYRNIAFNEKVTRVLLVESNRYVMHLLSIISVGAPRYSTSVAAVGVFLPIPDMTL